MQKKKFLSQLMAVVLAFSSINLNTVLASEPSIVAAADALESGKAVEVIIDDINNDVETNAEADVKVDIEAEARDLRYTSAGIAYSDTIEGGNIYFDENEGTIIDADTGITKADIPAEINGVRVTSIEDSAFEDCSCLTSIIIPEGVTSIGSSAFYNCSSLTSIVIPEGVTIIEHNTFAYCSSLTSVTIPEKVTSIGTFAFNDCSSLTSVTIPDSVTSIEDYAFEDCSSLTSITIPEGVTSIGEYAFKDCSSLTSIIIPEGVTSIGTSAFDHCSSLTSIVIPEGVTIIEYSTFSHCSSLTSVTIPKRVTSIGTSAFYDCSNLTSVTIPDSVTSIGASAFDHCSSLTSVIIPEDVTIIASGAFSSCSNLTSITIPKRVTSIGAHAFSYCSSLTSVIIPDSVTSIGYAGFSGCSNLTSVTIPDSVTEIGTWCFRNCSNLTSITISNSITNMESYTFENCSSLTSVIIPNNVTNIAECVFKGCSSLTNVTIPKGVTSIGGSAFYGSGLTSVTIPEGVTNIGDSAFYNCSSLKNVIFPESLKNIGDYAFSKCINLESVNLPNDISIGINAFDGCEKLMFSSNYNSKSSMAKAYRVLNVNNGDIIKANDEINSIRITPELEVDFGMCIYIKINNGSFDKALLEECQFKTRRSNRTWEYIISHQYDTWYDTLIHYIHDERSRALPYNIEYIDSSTLKVELSPGPYSTYSRDIAKGVPIYDIKLPAVAGSEKGKVTISVDGTGTPIENHEIAYAYNKGYVLSDSEYIPISSQSVSEVISIEPNQRIIYNDELSALSITPIDGTDSVESIYIKIRNGSFDQFLIESCQFKCEHGRETWEYIIANPIIGSSFDTIKHYVGDRGSRKLPYNIEYVSSDTLKVDLYPISDDCVDEIEGMTNGVPIYEIKLPAVSGAGGTTEVAVNGGVSNIESGGWYAIADIKNVFDFNSTSGTITAYSGQSESIIIPSAINGVNVTNISASAFSNCPNLTDITIPSSVISIDSTAFANCSPLKVYCTKGSTADNISLYPAGSTLIYNSNEPVALKGDVNGDDKVTTADALVVARLAIGKIVNNEIYTVCDYNKDGKVTTADALVLARYAIGKISSL